MKRAWAILIAQALGGGLSLRRYAALPEVTRGHQHQGAAPTPLISVIIPARNEEGRLGRLLGSLLAQDYTELEILVVDDRSSDRTAEVASGFTGIRVVRGIEPPSGWTGKPHACAQGATVARGQWLLFLDADTALHPAALSSALAYAEAHRLGFLSLFLQQECGTFWEKLLLPYAYAQYFAGVKARSVNTPGPGLSLANGQFMFFQRDVYDTIGGHGAVRNSLIEDVQMAAVLKSHGIPMTIARGESLGYVHMYAGLSPLWEGFVKNAFSFVRHNPRGAPLVIGNSLAIGSSVPLLLHCLARGGWERRTPGRAKLLALGVAGYLVPAALLTSWYRRFGVRSLYALAHPLAFGVFQAIALTSAWRTLIRHDVTWKGRHYGQAQRRPYYHLPRRQALELGVALLTAQHRLLADDGERLIASLPHKPRVEGSEYIPATGSFCLAANHYQRWGLWIGWEGGVLAAAVASRRAHDRDLHLLVIGESRVGPLWGRHFAVPGTHALYARVAAVWGMVPMPVGTEQTAGRALAVRRLLGYALGPGEGSAIGLFPEGEGGGADGLRPPLPGVGSLFSVLGRRGIAVVPAAMYEDADGLVVRFGPSFMPVRQGGRRQADGTAADMVMQAIARLLPPELRGVYRPAVPPIE